MEYCSIDAWPMDSTKRSLLIHLGFLGLYFMNSFHRTYDMGAQPMGAPGWPEFALLTASMDRKRMVLIHLSTVSFETSCFSTAAARTTTARAARNGLPAVAGFLVLNFICILLSTLTARS